jgi:hypothetical protein
MPIKKIPAYNINPSIQDLDIFFELRWQIPIYRKMTNTVIEIVPKITPIVRAEFE